MKKQFRLFTQLIIAVFMVMALLLPVTQAAAAATNGKQAAQNVRLIGAQLIDNHLYYTFKGQIEIANIAFKKQVTVVYNVGRTNGTAEAVYKMPTENGRELWTFQVNLDKAVFAGEGLDFAVRYKANGKTYWDNNAAADYTLNAEYGMTVLGARDVMLEDAAFDWTENAVTGTVALKNLGYPKTVKIVYTTDRWVTKKTAFATYTEKIDNGIGADDVERWTFKVPVDGKTKDVQFAIAYTVNKKTVWDNNHLQNYRYNR